MCLNASNLSNHTVFQYTVEYGNEEMLAHFIAVPDIVLVPVPGCCYPYLLGLARKVDAIFA